MARAPLLAWYKERCTLTLTDSNLRYLLAIHHLAQQSTEVSPLALAQAMGVTKPASPAS